MKVQYDKSSDAKYIRLKRGKVAWTEREEDWLLFDYSLRGEVLGIEILNASKHPVGVSVAGNHLVGFDVVEFNKHQRGEDESAKMEIEQSRLPEQALFVAA